LILHKLFGCTVDIIIKLNTFSNLIRVDSLSVLKKASDEVETSPTN